MISFEKYVDPSGMLSHHLGNKVAYCINNDVAYPCVKDDQYVKKGLVGFRVGDIVKMGFALVTFRQAFRKEDEKQIGKLALRTLTLLDDSFAKAAFKACATNEAKAPSVGSRPMQVVQSLV
ncbi:hypothetical protein B0H17DRAFT_1130148 [Mycena rosella]|uniref:Uncharacterized protein n=1 Tax=Mycena rosella TaxID=1033263 RepID=A0AAD7GPI5_MYCRO|nr:hypothetical protein B0H17DRAFT_1130148 [Mycena rosella]